MTTKTADFSFTGTASVAALALGAGLGGLDEAEAAIIFTDLGATISDEIQTFDIDGALGDDLTMFDTTGVSAGAKAATFFLLSLDGKLKGGYLNRFNVGDTINSADFFGSGKTGGPTGYFFKSGFGGASPWLDGQSGYIGLFREGAKGDYFGYVEARFEPDNTVFLGRAAFQTTPNTPITIGAVQISAPGGLGLLALGAAGLLARRRRQRERVQ